MILVVFKQTKDSLAFDPSMFIRKLSTVLPFKRMIKLWPSGFIMICV